MIASGFDFNKNHYLILLDNDVNFIQFAANVLLYNSIAFFFK